MSWTLAPNPYKYVYVRLLLRNTCYYATKYVSNKVWMQRKMQRSIMQLICSDYTMKYAAIMQRYPKLFMYLNSMLLTVHMLVIMKGFAVLLRFIPIINRINFLPGDDLFLAMWKCTFIFTLMHFSLVQPGSFSVSQIFWSVDLAAETTTAAVTLWQL